MYRVLPLVCFAAALISMPGLTAIYKIVDEQGKVTYTDAPPAGDRRAKPVQLPAINTQQPVVVRPPQAPVGQEGSSVTGPEYERAMITSPQEGFTLPAGQQTLTVALELEPSLHEGHWVQILVDGAPMGPPAQSSSQPLSGLVRGMHFISAQIFDEQGRAIIETAPITIHVQRSSLTAPAGGVTPDAGATPSPRAPN